MVITAAGDIPVHIPSGYIPSRPRQEARINRTIRRMVIIAMLPLHQLECRKIEVEWTALST